MDEYGKAVEASDDSALLRMRLACWITKATDTHSEYVTTYSSTTSTVVTRTRLSVIVRGLSCVLQFPWVARYCYCCDALAAVTLPWARTPVRLPQLRRANR